MANVELFAGLGKVSGTLSKTTIRTKDGIITRRVIAQVRNGKQRIYFRENKPRCTKPSAKETAQRQTFGFCSSVSSMLACKYQLGGAPKIRSLAYQTVKKRYQQCTERGMTPTAEFIIADIEAYAQLTPNDDPKSVIRKLKAYAEVQ